MAWQAEAACLGQTELFYGYTGKPVKALALCAACPVREQCLAEELGHNAGDQDYEIFGVFGGLLPDERIALLRIQGRRPLRTHCKRGHEFTEENTITRQKANKAGELKESRTCRQCTRVSTNASKRRRRIGQREAEKDTL